MFDCPPHTQTSPKRISVSVAGDIPVAPLSVAEREYASADALTDGSSTVHRPFAAIGELALKTGVPAESATTTSTVPVDGDDQPHT